MSTPLKLSREVLVITSQNTCNPCQDCNDCQNPQELICPLCKGTKTTPDKQKPCPRCQGKGTVKMPESKKTVF
jgi:DnaJ-class molecular chaperone